LVTKFDKTHNRIRLKSSSFKPVSANDVHARHEAVSTCASLTQMKNWLFWKGLGTLKIKHCKYVDTEMTIYYKYD